MRNEKEVEDDSQVGIYILYLDWVHCDGEVTYYVSTARP